MLKLLRSTNHTRGFSIVSVANADFSSSLGRTHRHTRRCSCLIIINNSNVVTLNTGTINYNNGPLNVITVKSNGSFTQKLGLPIGHVRATIRNVINTVIHKSRVSISVKHIASLSNNCTIGPSANRRCRCRRDGSTRRPVSQCCTNVLSYNLSTDVGSHTGRSRLPANAVHCFITILIRLARVGHCKCRVGTALTSNAASRQSVIAPLLAVTGSHRVNNNVRISPCSYFSSKLLSLI